LLGVLDEARTTAKVDDVHGAHWGLGVSAHG
jgi:hypothetical protein